MIRIKLLVVKQNYSQWFTWDEFLEGYYMITRDKDGNPNYDTFRF